MESGRKFFEKMRPGKKGHYVVEEEGANSIQSYASPNEKKFGFIAKTKLNKENSFGKVKYKIAAWEARNKDSANITYKVESNKKLGTSKTSVGVAKRRIVAGDAKTPSIDNLYTPSDDYLLPTTTTDENEERLLKYDPRMLARQVASWRLARSLNIRVLSREKYALRQLEEGGEELVAISAKVDGESLQDIQARYHQELSGTTDTRQHKEAMLGAAIFNGKVQKELSDLQLMDALTGQTDRHSGNIYIDLSTQTVRGIDNDQAFGHENSQLNYHNAVASFTQPRRGSGNAIEYNQSQIDYETAEKVLAINAHDLEKILIDKAGHEYGEFLKDEEVEAAKERLAAIQRQIRRLKADGKLVKVWDKSTYQAALDEDVKPVDFMSSLGNPGPKSHKSGSYVARSVRKIIG